MQTPKPPKGWPFSGEGDYAHDTSRIINRNPKPTQRQFVRSEATWGALTWYVQHPPEQGKAKIDDNEIDGEWVEL